MLRFCRANKVLIFVWKYPMKSKFENMSYEAGRALGSLLIVLSLALTGGCASTPREATSIELEVETPELSPVPVPMQPMSYYQLLSRMTLAELGRERMVLAALPRSPNTQLRLAMLFGYPRAQQDLGRAMAQLDSVLKSKDPAAIALQPLARLLADNYAERQKLEANLDRQGVLLKESQRKATELQEKIDDLADIERTLPARPQAVRPGRSGGGK
jgi:hypothetical protein